MKLRKTLSLVTMYVKTFKIDVIVFISNVIMCYGGYIAITLSVRPFVRPSVHTFVTDISASTGRNDLIYGFGMVTCTMSPLSRFTAHLLPVYNAT
jgi:hypothetical protein